MYSEITDNIHKKNMEAAFELACISLDKGGGPFGCVICDSSNTIIGRGHNMVTINNDPTQHAEIVAIRNTCNYYNHFDLSNCTLYTTCEPCPMCLAAIYWAKIDTVYYKNSNEDDDFSSYSKFIYDEFTKPIEERKIKMNKIS